MNLFSIIILVVILLLTCLALSYIGHTKNTGGCSGNCSECHQSCSIDKKHFK